MLIRYFFLLLFLAAKAAALPGQAALFLRPKPLLSPVKSAGSARWKWNLLPTTGNTPKHAASSSTLGETALPAI